MWNPEMATTKHKEFKLTGAVIEDLSLECPVGAYLSSGSPTSQLILKIIRTMDPHYSSLGINPVKRNRVTQYIAYLKEDYQTRYNHYCMKKQGVHTDRVAFYIEPKGIFQKCWSNNVECQGYRSPPVEISYELHQLLFGRTALPTKLQMKPSFAPVPDPIVDPNLDEKTRNALKLRSDENRESIFMLKYVINERLKYLPSKGGIDYKGLWGEQMVKLAKLNMSSLDRQYEQLNKPAKQKKKKNGDDVEEIEEEESVFVPPPRLPTELEEYAERTGTTDKLIQDDEPVDIQQQRVFAAVNNANKSKKGKKKKGNPEPVKHGGITYSSTTFVSSI
jgi:hypothetical protein